MKNAAVDNADYIVTVLLRSENYRQFLTEAYAHLKTSKKTFSLSFLANKIGCKLKSYPREVMSGRRTLSFDYAEGFAAAFGVKGEAKKLFLKLVELERSEEKSVVKNDILLIKTRLRNRISHKNKSPQDIFSEGSWIDVYAALGSEDKGATFEEISKRTKMYEASLKLTLEAMEKKGLVLANQRRDQFKPVVRHHFFEDLKKDDFFQNRFLAVLEKIKNKAKISVDSKTELFQCSTISVNSQDLPKLKSELRELLNKFVQDSEAPEGDQLTHILVGLI